MVFFFPPYSFFNSLMLVAKMRGGLGAWNGAGLIPVAQLTLYQKYCKICFPYVNLTLYGVLMQSVSTD